MLSGALGGCGLKHDDVAQVPVTQAVVQTGPPGEAVYLRSCARCHGAALEGDGNAPALTSARLAGLGDQILRMTITSGKGQMPGFGSLTQTQLDALVSYLRSQ